MRTEPWSKNKISVETCCDVLPGINFATASQFLSVSLNSREFIRVRSIKSKAILRDIVERSAVMKVFPANNVK